MFQSIFTIFALQVACNSFSEVAARQQEKLIRRTPDPPLTINTLTAKYTFPKNIRWESGTINNVTGPYLTTAPSQMPGEIDIRGADDDNDEIITTINTNAAGCDPASYSGTDEMEFVFQKDHWNIINHGKGGAIHYGYKRTPAAPKTSLVGEVKLTESPYSIVALILDKNDGKYTINAEPNLGLAPWDLISLMIVASKHIETCK